METLEAYAKRAAEGDTAALDAFIRGIKDDVYGLAMRMLAHPADAEDATQEILVKVITNLASFRGDSSVRTWVWRVAANHLLSVKRSRKEPEGLTFDAFEQMLDAGLAANMEPPATADAALLEEEVKLGCTHAMLMCLDREHRLAFLLGDVLELTSQEGAAILDIEAAAFRKRLSRARDRMRAFMQSKCGLVSDKASCRCRRQVGPGLHMGILDPRQLIYAVHPAKAEHEPSLWRAYQAIEDVHRSTTVFREHPDYAASDAFVDRLRNAIDKL